MENMTQIMKKGTYGFLTTAKLFALLFFTLLFAGCAHTTGERAYRTVQTPGKFELVYYTPTQELPGFKKVTVDGREIMVPVTGVVAPSSQSIYLLTHWEIRKGETVLDLGTGSGVQAIFAADHASHIVATDISNKSTSTAALNVKRHNLTDKIDVRLGDLFAPVQCGETFDVIIFNIDYPYNEDTQYLWKIHERFFDEAGKYLNPNGRIYYQSGLVSNVPRIQAMAEKNNLRIVSMRMDVSWEDLKEPIVYVIKRIGDHRLSL
jgi:release factor glutamine methyltransferase